MHCCKCKKFSSSSNVICILYTTQWISLLKSSLKNDRVQIKLNNVFLKSNLNLHQLAAMVPIDDTNRTLRFTRFFTRNFEQFLAISCVTEARYNRTTCSSEAWFSKQHWPRAYTWVPGRIQFREQSETFRKSRVKHAGNSVWPVSCSGSVDLLVDRRQVDFSVVVGASGEDERLIERFVLGGFCRCNLRLIGPPWSPEECFFPVRVLADGHRDRATGIHSYLARSLIKRFLIAAFAFGGDNEKRAAFVRFDRSDADDGYWWPGR